MDMIQITLFFCCYSIYISAAMTLIRHQRLSSNPATATTYEQRRRRLRLLGISNSSTPLSTINWSGHRVQGHNRTHNTCSPLVGHDLNNNPQHRRQLLQSDGDDNGGERFKRYFVGAFIFKRPEDGELALHVFEQHKVQVRYSEKEYELLNRVSSEYSAKANGSSNFITSVYLMQKYEPVASSSQGISLMNVQDSSGQIIITRQTQANMEFKRKFVPLLTHEYSPGTDKEMCNLETFYSSVVFNVN
ncbi:uncharacterized protein LOC129760459 [Uranotaenia lowii]|uniref:uncharacterized protein LOC129760459 n=1 Tax=Uranotaenia lowii TaxID=190385 RepID=UPI002479E789|nr:uncharacterized protein LOC129760459 [Uranotaenia lowii]